jgi:hypothetical protein
MYTTLKKRLVRNLEEQEHKTQGTNAPPVLEKEE